MQALTESVILRIASGGKLRTVLYRDLLAVGFDILGGEYLGLNA